MADNKVVNNGVSKINENINKAASSTSQNLNEISDTLTNIAQDLGDGLKLTAKESAKDKKIQIDLDEEKLKEQIDGLNVFAPDIAEILNNLLFINTSILDSINSQVENKNVEKPEEENTLESKASNINTDSKDVKDLAGLTNLADITGTGFSILGNILKDLYTLFDTVLKGVAEGQLAQVLVNVAAPVTTDTIQAQAEESNKEQTKGVLAGFFQGISGPLESVAAGLLMISVAAAILQTIQLDSNLIGTIIILDTFMITTFAVLNRIKNTQQQNPDLIDTEGTKEGSVLNIIQNFAIMVGLTAGSLLLCAILADTIVENWQGILISLAIIFGTALVTLTALNATALLIKNLTKNDSPIVTSVNEFAKLILTISIVTVLCALLEPIIMRGLEVAAIILTETLATFLILGGMLALVGESVSKEQLEAFSGILRTTTILIGLLAAMTIILGIIPTEIIVQGLISVTLLVGLVDSIFFMLSRSLQKLENISADRLQQLFNILTVTTVLIGLLSVMTIVLGLLDTNVIIQGIAAVILISAIPLIMIEVMSRITENSDKMAQALVGVGLASILTIAVTGLAWLIITMLGGFETSQVLNTMLAIGLTTLLIFAVGAAGIGLAALASVLGVSVLPALAAIGIASVISIAIAGLAILLTNILDPTTAQNAIVAAGAITLTSIALVTVGSATILLAALAIPLTISVGFAITSINLIRRVLEAFINLIVDLGPLTALLASADLTTFGAMIESISNTMIGLTGLNAVLTLFNLVALPLVVNVGLASASLIAINFGLRLFINQYNTLSNILLNSTATEDLNLENLSQNIRALAGLSEVINTFTAPTVQGILAVNFAMNFAINFAKKIQQVGNDETINRVVNLANSLANLASNANGLAELATSIKAVADATKELNEAQTNNKISVEALTGQVANQANMMQRIERIPQEKETDNSQENAERIISLLQNMTDEMQVMSASMRDMSQNQSTMLKRGDRVATKFM